MSRGGRRREPSSVSPPERKKKKKRKNPAAQPLCKLPGYKTTSEEIPFPGPAGLTFRPPQGAAQLSARLAALPAPHAALQQPLLSARHRLPSPSPPCRCHWLWGGPPRRPTAAKVGSRAPRGRSRGEKQDPAASFGNGAAGGASAGAQQRSRVAQGEKLGGGGASTFPVQQIWSPELASPPCCLGKSVGCATALLQLQAAARSPAPGSCGPYPAPLEGRGRERRWLGTSKSFVITPSTEQQRGSGSPAIIPLACNAVIFISVIRITLCYRRAGSVVLGTLCMQPQKRQE